MPSNVYNLSYLSCLLSVHMLFIQSKEDERWLLILPETDIDVNTRTTSTLSVATDGLALFWSAMVII